MVVGLGAEEGTSLCQGFENISMGNFRKILRYFDYGVPPKNPDSVKVHTFFFNPDEDVFEQGRRFVRGARISQRDAERLSGSEMYHPVIAGKKVLESMEVKLENPSISTVFNIYKKSLKYQNQMDRLGKYNPRLDLSFAEWNLQEEGTRVILRPHKVEIEGEGPLPFQIRGLDDFLMNEGIWHEKNGVVQLSKI